MKYPLLAAGFCVIANSAIAETPVLTVYTYDSFVSDWGPGPAVEAAFEKTCGCDLKFVGAGDGAALLARVRLEGARTKADVVLGLDTNLTQTARETGLFAPHGVSADLDLPVAWVDDFFLPFDWGYFAFVYKRDSIADVPTNFKELAASDLKVIIQDPRSSTPGLGLLMWVKAAYGNEAPAIWDGLSDNIVTVTKGWSEAYGMFLEDEADMVLSYTTSPAYHLIAEEDAGKAAAPFSEGHYLQIEVAGKIAATDQPELADAFLEFMVSEAFQAIIPTTNWMYPAATPAGGLPDGFDRLITPDKSLMVDSDKAVAMREEALAEWLSALSK